MVVSLFFASYPKGWKREPDYNNYVLRKDVATYNYSCSLANLPQICLKHKY